MSKKISLTCDEATTICDKSQYGEAFFYEKVKLGFHMLFCKYCVVYSKQNKILTKIFKIEVQKCKSQKKQLSVVEKKEIKKRLLKELERSVF